MKEKKESKEKKKKLSPKELMKIVVDEELLKQNKEATKEQGNVPKLNKEKVEIIVEKKWWELPISKDDFKIKKYEDKFYAHHKDWKDCVWIGPYESKKDINEVIKSYEIESNKPMMGRKLINVHSIIIEF